MKYNKTLAFTNSPLSGYYNYNDLFQIYPAEFDNMPTATGQKHYPIIIEFITTESDDLKIKIGGESSKFLNDLASSDAKSTEIVSLLSLISNHHFFKYKSSKSWYIPLNSTLPEEDLNSMSSSWGLTLFYWPELANEMTIDKFTEQNIDKVPFIPHGQYYVQEPSFDQKAGSVIHLPETITMVLDSYYRLNDDTKKVIDYAINHFVAAFEIWRSRKSLSLIAAFTAIETMVNLENRGMKIVKCSTCGQPQFKVSQKFRNFLSKYIGESPSNKKKFNGFYSLRSKIIHTGEQLISENLWTEIDDKVLQKEYISQIEILQLARLSIINWLIKNHFLWKIKTAKKIIME